MGRPPKLTPEVQGEIVNAIVAGATYKAAAEYAGVSYESFNLWMKRPGRMYLQFSQAVTRANARARVNLLARIQQSAKDGDWRAAAWILERRFRDEYGQSVEITGDKEKPVHVFDHGRTVAALAPGSIPDHRAPGEGEGAGDGPALGQDVHGG